LFCNTTGIGNTAVGQASLGCVTTGARNTALGFVAGCCITSGAYNVILGSATATGFGTESCNIFISDGAGNIRIFATGSTGFVGINTTAPTQQTHIDGNLRVTGAIYDSTNSPGTSNQILSSTVTGTDWVDLGAITGVDGSGSATLVAYWVDGNTITGSAGFFFDNITNTLTVPSFIESSAERFKTDILPLTGSLEKIQQMEGVTFHRIDGNNRKEIGFIADHVEKIYPELVSHDPDGRVHGLQYPRITAILVEGVKELTQLVHSQDIFIQDLKSRIEQLEKK
jgi:hypothetical protein